MTCPDKGPFESEFNDRPVDLFRIFLNGSLAIIILVLPFLFCDTLIAPQGFGTASSSQISWKASTISKPVMYIVANPSKAFLAEFLPSCTHLEEFEKVWNANLYVEAESEICYPLFGHRNFNKTILNKSIFDRNEFFIQNLETYSDQPFPHKKNIVISHFFEKLSRIEWKRLSDSLHKFDLNIIIITEIDKATVFNEYARWSQKRKCPISFGSHLSDFLTKRSNFNHNLYIQLLDIFMRRHVRTFLFENLPSNERMLNSATMCELFDICQVTDAESSFRGRLKSPPKKIFANEAGWILWQWHHFRNRENACNLTECVRILSLNENMCNLINCTCTLGVDTEDLTKSEMSNIASFENGLKLERINSASTSVKMALFCHAKAGNEMELRENFQELPLESKEELNRLAANCTRFQECL